MRYRTAASCGACDPWNNGKEVPRWGVAEIQKMSPSTTHQVGIILDVQAWSEKLYLMSRHG